MKSQLVETKTQKLSLNESIGKTQKLHFVDAEVDMGFFEEHSFEVKDGIVIRSGCQRINKCGCNCNDCFISGNI